MGGGCPSCGLRGDKRALGMLLLDDDCAWGLLRRRGLGPTKIPDLALAFGVWKKLALKSSSEIGTGRVGIGWIGAYGSEDDMAGKGAG